MFYTPFHILCESCRPRSITQPGDHRRLPSVYVCTQTSVRPTHASTLNDFTDTHHYTPGISLLLQPLLIILGLCVYRSLFVSHRSDTRQRLYCHFFDRKVRIFVERSHQASLGRALVLR